MLWNCDTDEKVVNPQLCLNFLDNKCVRRLNKNCKDVHARHPYQWQSEMDGAWKDLPDTHSKELEQAYNSPANDGTYIYSTGRHQSWFANFEEMTLESGCECVQLRRLSTASSVLCTHGMATVFDWYFIDERDRWIKYGLSNTTHRRECVTGSTAYDIEAFFSRNDAKQMKIASKLHNYLIDFGKMTQMNTESGVERPVRRRPAKLKPRLIAPVTATPAAGGAALCSGAGAGPGAGASPRHSGALAAGPSRLKFEWFFKDEHKRWIKYGESNKVHGTAFTTMMTSDDIEAKFLQDPTTPLNIKSYRSQYVIDFRKMTQRNKLTNVEREVCRKPINLLKLEETNASHSHSIYTSKPKNLVRIQDTNSSSSSSASYPPHWSPMTDGGLVTTVTLNHSHPEYNQYVSFIQRTLRNFQVIAMKRIQNPYLWTAYVNRKQYMQRKYPKTDFLETHLFHGTDGANIEAISEDNLDWRLHGTHSGQNHGRGSYFSNDASLSAGYCRSRSKALLVVKVLVGNITRGDCNTIKPPQDCDTTVDSIEAPRIFVKYDTQEYYPEYCVMFK